MYATESQAEAKIIANSDLNKFNMFYMHLN